MPSVTSLYVNPNRVVTSAGTWLNRRGSCDSAQYVATCSEMKFKKFSFVVTTTSLPYNRFHEINKQHVTRQASGCALGDCAVFCCGVIFHCLLYEYWPAKRHHIAARRTITAPYHNRNVIVVVGWADAGAEYNTVIELKSGHHAA